MPSNGRLRCGDDARKGEGAEDLGDVLTKTAAGNVLNPFAGMSSSNAPTANAAVSGKNLMVNFDE